MKRRPFRWLQRQIKGWMRRRHFARDYQEFVRLSAARPRGMEIRWNDRYPCLDDQLTATGFDRHYVYHTAWAARVLAQTSPSLHVDVSSSLYFCAMLSAFIPIRFLDYRPPDLRLPKLTVEGGDLMRLPFADDAVQSLSCMHVIEHVGLGRYGEPLDPDGDLKAVLELQRVLAPGGDLLLVVPVGRPRIQFNAHRVYAYEQIVEQFSKLTLRQFALIPDKASEGGLIQDASVDLAGRQQYACGCFWWAKQ